MTKFLVDLGPRSYDVVVGEGVRRNLAPLIAERCPDAQAAVIMTSAPIRRQPWFDISTGLMEHVIEVPDGEAAKSLDVVSRTLEAIARCGLSRRDVMVGVGGGAVTDVAGFVAATYMRGVAVAHVPTTLLGQVDAAIGGKAGVDLAAGKNLAGAFHQPIGVLCDQEVLSTLPERDLLAGEGEVAKCLILRRTTLEDIEAMSRRASIEASIELKCQIVSNDEREGGRRAVLNYGHTLGHALERRALDRGRDELRHGEAVAVGLQFAARLAYEMGRVTHDVVAYHDQVLVSLGLRRRLPEWASVDDLIELISRDKKAHHDVTFVLDGPDGFETVHDVSPLLVREVLQSWRDEDE